MKKLYKPICFIAAVAAMSLTSCQKETYAPGSEEGTVITVHATVEDVANASKTHIDGTQVYWDQDEQMKVVSFDAAAPETSGKESNSSSFTPSADYTTATFTVTVDNEAANTIAGVYPASAAKGLSSIDNNSTNALKYKVELKANQIATANSYDPEAYVMITRPQTLPVENNEWTASYIRAAALTRMEVSGLNDNINSVTITFPEGQAAAGRRYFDLATSMPGTFYSASNKYNEIKISYAEPIPSGANQNVWFTSWNVDVAAGETVTVKVESDTKIYTKTFNATKAISLKENFLNIMPIDMTGATVEDINPAEDYSGEYLIIAKGNDNWVYMSTYNNSKSAFDGTNSSTPASRDYSTLMIDDFAGADEYTWTLTKVDNNLYTLYNEALNSYLDLSASSTDVKLSDTAINHEVTINDKGAYQINYINSTRSLRGNPLSTYRFANYVTTGSQSDIYLLPWVESTEPMLIVSQPEQTVAADAESVSFAYVAKNITGEISAIKDTDADNIINAVSVDKASSTVNVTLNPNTEEVEKIATIILSAEGVDNVTLSITQKAKLSSGTVELLNEDFTSITAGNSTDTGGSSSKWNGNENFITLTNVYQAGGAIKIGASGKTGLIKTQDFNVPAGSTLNVQFDVKGWTKVEGDIEVVFGGKTETVTYTATMADEFETKSVEFTVDSETTSSVTIATTANRAFLDNIVIYYKM